MPRRGDPGGVLREAGETAADLLARADGPLSEPEHLGKDRLTSSEGERVARGVG